MARMSAKASSTFVNPDNSTAVRFDPMTLRWPTMSVTAAVVPRWERRRWATVAGLVPSVCTRKAPTASLPVAWAT
jgi:hypothetical protein